MIGDPGTGKSMLARSMTDLLPQDALEDVLVYPNEDDENEPRVRSVPAGRAERIVRIQKEAIREQKEKAQRMLLIGFGAVAFLLVIVAIPSGDILTLLFGMFLLMFGYMFIRSRLGSGDEGRIPKVLVKHELDDRPPFVDATATLSGSLLGDVRHDPSNPVVWRHLHTTESSLVQFTGPTKVCSTSMRSIFYVLRNNKHCLLPCKSELSQFLDGLNDPRVH